MSAVNVGWAIIAVGAVVLIVAVVWACRVLADRRDNPRPPTARQRHRRGF